MKQPHDAQIDWQLLTRNRDKVTILTADKGYVWELLRHKLRSEGVKPVIKHCEFGWHGVATNVLLDDTTYHQRSTIEAAFFALRRKYGKIIRARTWVGQFRELVLKCAIRNVELALDDSNGGIEASKQAQLKIDISTLAVWDLLICVRTSSPHPKHLDTECELVTWTQHSTRSSILHAQNTALR
jgi:hypothetical protein